MYLERHNSIKSAEMKQVAYNGSHNSTFTSYFYYQSILTLKICFKDVCIYLKVRVRVRKKSSTASFL